MLCDFCFCKTFKTELYEIEDRFRFRRLLGKAVFEGNEVCTKSREKPLFVSASYRSTVGTHFGKRLGEGAVRQASLDLRSNAVPQALIDRIALARLLAVLPLAELPFGHGIDRSLAARAER